MSVPVRRGAAALLSLGALLAAPSVAAAQRGGGAGGYDYESFGCRSQQILVTNGRCAARRPVPAIYASPSAPRAGAPVTLSADSPGRGLTYKWDLDHDGAFDDATGAGTPATFTAGNHRVRVQATYEDVRVGQATTTL